MPSHPCLSLSRRHLCPFALWPVLPTALGERDFPDYYEHSVAVAPRGR